MDRQSFEKFCEQSEQVSWTPPLNRSIKETLDHYTNMAKDYDQIIAVSGYQKAAEEAAKRFARDMEKEKSLSKSMRILDVGCGTGLSGLELHKYGYTNVDGLDANEAMLNISKTKKVYKKYYHAMIGGGATLEIDDNTYDAATVVGTMMPGGMDESAFPDLIRIVKPGGYISIMVRELYVEKIYQNLEKEIQKHQDSQKWKMVSKESFPDYMKGEPGLVFLFQILPRED